MVTKSIIEEVSLKQLEILNKKDLGLDRQLKNSIHLKTLSSHVLIITGIRRSGKSTLLSQIITEIKSKVFFLNFEDPRLFNFEFNDFNRIDQILEEKGCSFICIDEIQIIGHWERYIRSLTDRKIKVLITGSNASLLTKELGAKLTGRHLTHELFPFSFSEFCEFKKAKPNVKQISKYLKSGGFPEMVKQNDPNILSQLFEDILMRDIVARYGIRDVRSLKLLASYLVSNIGSLFSGNKLKEKFNIAATSTIMEYISYLEDSYLFYFVPKFSYSQRKQIVNPRKVYAVDCGLVNATSVSFSADIERIFENLIFNHLRRSHKELYYFSDKGECDFVVCDKGNIIDLIQVCYDLNEDNLQRELKGIYAAMEFFKINQASIISFNQSDRFTNDEKTVDVIPASDFLVKHF